MFIAVYEFQVKKGQSDPFRRAWRDVTNAIFESCGSLGSRLHRSQQPDIYIGYAQWPSREQWQKECLTTGTTFSEARTRMRQSLHGVRVVYELEVCDDLLRDVPANQTID